MQLIEAIVKPNKLEAIKASLARLGILGMTAIECKGYGKQMGHSERYRGPKLEPGFVPKVLLQVCVRDEDKAAAVKAIIECSKTGNVGDGKIFVMPVSEVIRIRTEESGEAALEDRDTENAMDKVPPVTNPSVDVAELLRHLMGDTGDLQESMGGFRIKIFHLKAFPWGEVFKALAYRDFKIYVTRHKADLIIEAMV